MKTIEVTISPDGRSRVEAKGFAGTACQAATRFLLRALGICRSQQLTNEFYRAAQPATQRTEQQS